MRYSVLDLAMKCSSRLPDYNTHWVLIYVLFVECYICLFYVLFSWIKVFLYKTKNISEVIYSFQPIRKYKKWIYDLLVERVNQIWLCCIKSIFTVKDDVHTVSCLWVAK